MRVREFRVVFMGTPEFAVPAFKAILAADFHVVAAYTQPPRPAGRGYKIVPSPVHNLAETHNIPVYTPASLKTEEAQAQLRLLKPDVAVVAAYGLILPQTVLDIPRLGCINIHGSILPRWRGAAPIQRALMMGDAETGVSIMQMEAGLDSGPYYKISRLPITAASTSSSLYVALADIGAKDIVEILKKLAAGKTLPLTKQDEACVTLAPKLSPEEGILNWSFPAAKIDRYIRSLNPWPGTYTFWQGSRLKILEARPINSAEKSPHKPGTVLDDTLTIMCGDGSKLQILRLQQPGGKPLDTRDFLNGVSIPVGSVFDATL